MSTKSVTKEMRDKLREPLPQEAIKEHPTLKGMSSIKAMYVIERLNDVFGVGAWSIKADMIGELSSSTKTTQYGKERIEHTSLVKTSLTISEYGIYHECIAGSTNTDEGDAAKGGITDAITKICSWLEIGIDVFKGTHAAVTQQPAQQTQQSAPAKPAAKTPIKKEEPAKVEQGKQVAEPTDEEKASRFLKQTPPAKVEEGTNGPVPQETKDAIAAASTKEQLVTIWNDCTGLHTNTEFSKLITSRKKEILTPQTA